MNFTNIKKLITIAILPLFAVGCSGIQLEPVTTTVDCTQDWVAPKNPVVIETQMTLEKVRVVCMNSKSYGCTYYPSSAEKPYRIYYTTLGVLEHERLHIQCGPLHKGER